MKSIIQYLYNGETEVRAKDLDEFFRIARKFRIIGLYNGSEPDEYSLNDSAESHESLSSPEPNSMKCTVTFNLVDTNENDRDGSAPSRRPSKRPRLDSSARGTDILSPASSPAKEKRNEYIHEISSFYLYEPFASSEYLN